MDSLCSLLVAALSLAWLLPAAPPALAQAHPEIVVGCDAAGKLVARYDTEKPYPIPASHFLELSGYAQAFPGFSSISEELATPDFRALDPSAEIAFELVSADPGIQVWNDRGTGPMRPGEQFTLGHPFFDAHAVWNITDGAPGEPYTIELKLLDRTGRHGASEVIAPRFTPDDAKEVFLCPMRCREGTLYDAPGACPECAMPLKLVSAKTYRVAVTAEGAASQAEPIRAGAETALRFRIATPTGEPVGALEVVHEKLLHLLMVSSDLAWFAHEHPERQPDGSFLLRFAFPHGGTFTLYHDFTPERVGMQVVPVELEVLGEVPPPRPLAPGTERVSRVGGYAVELRASAPLTSVRTQHLAFQVTRDGAPVTDLEPFLGAMGHLIVISADRQRFVHSHPNEAPRAPGELVRGGPEVVFQAQFPAPGAYKAWAQFQHHGAVVTAPFEIEVVSPLAALEARERDGAGGR